MRLIKYRSTGWLLSLLIQLLWIPVAGAGIIESWSLDNVTTDPEPHVEGLTYNSTVFTDHLKTDTNGAVIWVESDVMAPGSSVVTMDDVDGSNCIMTSGMNPFDDSIKQCSDPFQTSKRFKLSATRADTSIDLVYIVGGLTDPLPYRILTKYLNATGLSIKSFSIDLGFDTGDMFISATDLDELDFSDRDGVPWTGQVSTGDVPSLDLDALFPFGLFGDADTDPDHDIDGYFDSTDRGRFFLEATSRLIESNGISANYFDLVGNWLPKSNVLLGYFLDHDDDVLTDPILVAHLTDTGWVTLRPDDWWMDMMIPVPAQNPDGTLADSVLANWGLDPLYSQDAIEDLANLNLNIHVTIGDYTQWPTFDGEQAKFTLRFTLDSDLLLLDGFED